VTLRQGSGTSRGAARSAADAGGSAADSSSSSSISSSSSSSSTSTSTSTSSVLPSTKKWQRVVVGGGVTLWGGGRDMGVEEVGVWLTSVELGTQFTRVTSVKVQILTQKR
jgi:hypothetical protein